MYPSSHFISITPLKAFLVPNKLLVDLRGEEGGHPSPGQIACQSEGGRGRTDIEKE
jgi:hypothetical protein